MASFVQDLISEYTEI